MKLSVVNYKHSSNGISLQLLPETEIEEGLLCGIFQHGKMKTGYPGEARGNTGFYLSWKNEDPPSS